jgi:hypothetical protein
MNDVPLPQTRFLALLEAYGARPERWPEHERNAAIELLDTSESARVLAREQHSLDAWLSVPDTAKISADLNRRLNAIPEQCGRALLVRPLRVRALWLPALGWAAAATVGIWLGARSATTDRYVVNSDDTEQAAAQTENERLAISGGLFDDSEAP